MGRGLGGQRFGLIEVESEKTRSARPDERPSFALFGEIARANGLPAEMVKQYAPTALDQVFG